MCVFVICMLEGYEENANIAKMPIKWLASLTVFLIVFAVLLPSKETLLLMQAAKLATPENVNAVFEALKTAMDYAVTLFE